jgi:nucleosome binding factor SPN SPT16 subunit
VRTCADTLLSEAGVTLVVHEKPKGEDGNSQADEILAVVAAGSLTVGMVTKEAAEGTMTVHAAGALKAKGAAVVEVGPGLANAMAAKDAAELPFMKKAAQLTTKAMTWAVESVEGIVNDESKMAHSKLSEQCEDKILDPKALGLKDLESDDVDICYPPIFQSGGEYELKMSAVSSDKKMHYGVVLISLGARFQQYCGNVARTLMIDPSKAMEETYDAALAAQEAALAALVDGADLAAPFDAAKAALIAANPRGKGEELAAKLGKTIGTAIGLELREASMMLGPKSRGAAQKVRAGQCYNVQIALPGLVNEAAKEGTKGRNWAIMIADTVVVAAAGAAPEVLTKGVTKAVKDVAYQINDDEVGLYTLNAVDP